MAYILYIPDEDTYTQKEFDTLRDIAQWSIVAALNEPVELSHILYINKGGDTYTRKQFETLADLARWSVLDALNGGESEPKKEEEAVAPVEVAVTVQKPTVAVDYAMLAKKFLTEVFSTAFRFETCRNAKEAVSFEDARFFLQILANHASVIASTFAPSDDTGIQWTSLPAEFIIELQKTVATFSPLDYEGCGRDMVALYAAHPTAKEVFNLINIFRSWSFHTSWSDYTIGYKGSTFTEHELNRLMVTLIGEWLCNVPISDELHDMMIKLITIQCLQKGAPDITMGSNDFLSYYHGKLSKIFPSSFYLWVVRGSQHRHCKKALEELGISQVRRAGGQKFIGIQENTQTPGSMQFVCNLHPAMQHPWHTVGSIELPPVDMDIGIETDCMFAPI
jgi:hypothetical protein